MRLYVRLLIGLLRRSTRGRRDLLMENLVLRQQLEVYARQPKRPRLRNEDRLFWSVVARIWSPWRLRLRLVQPETVVRWHRTAWRQYWTWKSRRRESGRPRIDRELRELIIGLARGTWSKCRRRLTARAPPQLLQHMWQWKSSACTAGPGEIPNEMGYIGTDRRRTFCALGAAGTLITRKMACGPRCCRSARKPRLPCPDQL